MHGGGGDGLIVNGHSRGRILHSLRSKCDCLCPYNHNLPITENNNIKLVLCLLATCFSSGGWVGRHPSWEGGLEIVVENK